MRHASQAMSALSVQSLRSIGTRVGVAGASTQSAGQLAARIPRMMRDNKVTSGLVALEMYRLVQSGSDEGRQLAAELQMNGIDIDSAIAELRDSDPQLARILGKLSFQADDVNDTTSVMDIGRFADELRAIERAVATVGGFAALANLRNVLGMDDSILNLYLQVETLKGRM